MSGENGCEKLNKRDFELLGQVFTAEIQNILPAQIGKSRPVKSLQERGFIEPYERILPRRFPVRVSGWALTEAGRITYCQNCSDPKHQ